MVGRYRARTPVQRIGGELIRKTVVWASASPLPTSLCCNGLHARKSGGMQLLTTVPPSSYCMAMGMGLPENRLMRADSSCCKRQRGLVAAGVCPKATRRSGGFFVA